MGTWVGRQTPAGHRKRGTISVSQQIRYWGRQPFGGLCSAFLSCQLRAFCTEGPWLGLTTSSPPLPTVSFTSLSLMLAKSPPPFYKKRVG